ncbi:MAG: hypothetical protein FRX48_05142 [Lasallia pustulata]|uniref:Uncharacterized protein n=1 Tax=Lasallia pustulata TaxID=136370 RepID=A0A5M8PPB0_9LECA|nr:MAG: hypothetical protein FRX48_05142 [Lasallia pustulata]
MPMRNSRPVSLQDPEDLCSEEVYLEKYAYDRRESLSDYGDHKPPASYSNSSRDSSPSHQPMLRTSSPRRKQWGKQPSYFYRIPNTIVRYLCCALMSAVILFILLLIRMSWVSSRQLERWPKPPSPPAEWESFEFLKGYYGGIRTLVPREQNNPEYPHDGEAEPAPEVNSTITERQASIFPSSSPFDPYPDYTSAAYLSQYVAKQDCFFDSEDRVRIPSVHSYSGVPQGMPDHIMGSYDLLGLRNDICFERFGRLGPYGFGYGKKTGGIGAGLNGDREGAERTWSKVPEVNYKEIRWAEAQNQCMRKNSARFERPGTDDQPAMPAEQSRGNQKGHIRSREKSPSDSAPLLNTTGNGLQEGGKILLPRTAVVIRTWSDFEYTQEDILYLRSLISELSLLSGGEYTVHFLIHVKDNKIPIWADEETYERVLREATPPEFQGMGTLWSEAQMGLIYNGLSESFYLGLPVHGVYRSTFMPLQYFAHKHPEYDHFWNWEMDIRYTGQWYHLFDRVRQWAKAQPRKGLWERNARFYIPSVHGTWEDFKQMVRVQSEMGTSSPNNIWSSLSAGMPPTSGSAQPQADQPVWGPLPPQDDNVSTASDPTPPTPYDKDKYTWGTHEEADLITFSPIFDPAGTTWLLSSDHTGYNTTRSPPPRRAAVVTASRLSRRLLAAMHADTALRRLSMFSEMWAPSCALHHGFKAVYAPHPVYVDRDWPPTYLAGVMNAGRNGASGGGRRSVFGEREHNFKGQSWFYNAGFAPNLWRRWAGLRVDGGVGRRRRGRGREDVFAGGAFASG